MILAIDFCMYIHYYIYIDTREVVLKYEDRKEYFRDYRKRKRKIVADLEIEERNKLDLIVKMKNITIADWIRQNIEEDYKKYKEQ